MAKVGLTPAQCRAARNAVGLSQKRLAEEAEVSVPVVQEFEAKGGRVPMEKNLRDIRAALERAGVEFQTSAEGRALIAFNDPDARLPEAAADSSQ